MVKDSIQQIIESCGFCRAEEVQKLQVMKAGMTNRSYSFYVQNKRYIIRIPVRVLSSLSTAPRNMMFIV